MRSHSLLKAIGKRIMELRVDKGLSQRQLSLLCGIDNSTISKIELGKINITLLRLLKLSIGLDVFVEELLPPKFIGTGKSVNPKVNLRA